MVSHFESENHQLFWTNKQKKIVKNPEIHRTKKILALIQVGGGRGGGGGGYAEKNGSLVDLSEIRDFFFSLFKNKLNKHRIEA